MTTSGRAARPFTDRIESLRSRGMRYADLESGCNRARSTGWFNNLVNYGPTRVGPPTQEMFADFATLFKVSQARVAEMIAEEWYGVAKIQMSDRVRTIASSLDSLSEADAVIVETLAHRLAQDAS